MDFNLLLGGEAGQGLATLEEILSRVLFRKGFHIFCTKDYMSRIRGGHNFSQIRFSTEPLTGPGREIDLLLALNEETLLLHQEKLKDKGIILLNGVQTQKNHRVISLDAGKMASALGDPRVANTILVGALCKMIGLERGGVEDLMASRFKDAKVLELNQKALSLGYHEVKEVFSIPELERLPNEIMLSGNESIGLGAAAAGLRFYSAYPMTPATGIMNYLASKQEELGLVVEQAEDEIAAINMVLGASYGGIRAMTGTSGGGFSLMVEGLGLAGITETPVVVANVQRPGPATGLPTRTEQGDLLFVIHASQGDFPLFVTAPRDTSDAFFQTFHAFTIAEKYQIPVVILSDQFLADSLTNVKEFPLEDLKIKRFFLEEETLKGEYGRYAITNDGISPRAYPGQILNQVVLVDSDEHDANGHIIEDGITRKAMVDKRAMKMARLKEEELLEPLFFGEEEEEMDLFILSFGSTFGPLLEALKLFKEKDIKVGLLSFNNLWPLPLKELMYRKDKTRRFITVENNSTAQLKQLIQSQTQIEISGQILKYDGRPFSGVEIFERICQEVLSR